MNLRCLNLHLYRFVLLKHVYATEQGMKGEKGDSGRPGVHVSFICVCVCVSVLLKKKKKNTV